MANVTFTCASKIREQTVAARQKVRSPRRIAQLFELWRRTRMAIAEWDSRALQREQLACRNDHLLADIGLMRERQIVDPSKLFCWLP